MDEKRKCIFTNLPATSKIKITSSKHNWAKSVPCSKDFLEKKGSRPLNELEFRLVELFYEQELARLRVEHYEAQMNEIRSLSLKKPQIYKPIDWPPKEGIEVELTQEDKEWLDAPLGPTEDDKYLGIKKQVEQSENLTKEKEDDNIDKDNDNDMWG